MSNSKNRCHAGYRWKLLSSVSALTLMGSVGIAQAAPADGVPSLWLELGWQFDAVSGSADPFLPPFSDAFTTIGGKSADVAQKVMSYSYGGQSRISFQPAGTDWFFAASIRYGRAHGRKTIHYETNEPALILHTTGRYGVYPSSNPKILYQPARKFASTAAGNLDTHVILDFQAGRDFGLGMFGHDSVSALSAGVRFAQINVTAGADLGGDSDFHFSRSRYSFGFHTFIPTGAIWHDYSGHSRNEMKFQGVGPSLSWNASLPIAGNAQDGEIAIDWGANAALLFGRQRTRGVHQVTGRYRGPGHFYETPTYAHSTPHNRSRNVTVPNAGGFAGMSLQWSNAKISLGYRGDFFFGALDGGIDAASKITRGYYGPFASVSIGLGGSSGN